MSDVSKLAEEARKLIDSGKVSEKQAMMVGILTVLTAIADELHQVRVHLDEWRKEEASQED